MSKTAATQGVMANILIQSGSDKGMIVLPLLNAGTPQGAMALCENALAAINTELLPAITACLSEQAYIAGVTVHGMVPGRLPAQEFNETTDYPGELGTDACAAQVAAIVNFYGDPDDYSPGNKLRTARNFLFGIAETMVNNSVVADALSAALGTFAAVLINGFLGADGAQWVRGMRGIARNEDGEPDLEDEIPQVVKGTPNRRVRTQKGRLRPD